MTLLLLSGSAGAQPRGPTAAVLVPAAKPPVKGETALGIWALAETGSAPASVIDELRGRLRDPDKELRLAAAWALGHLQVAGTGREAAGFDEPARMLGQGRPSYPRDAYYAGIQGVVLVEFVIDETGRVIHSEVRQSIRLLDAAAVDCVKRWRFAPARLAGKAVPAMAIAPVAFRIGS